MNDRYACKNILPLWRLTDPLSEENAAALIAGVDPHSVDDTRMCFRNRETNLTDSDGITWVHTAQTALENAVMAGRLPATIRRSAWERGSIEAEVIAWVEQQIDSSRAPQAGKVG